MNLSNLKPEEGSIHTSKKRFGRGQGSGKGGTASRGHNGQKSRSGYSKKFGFEGGQMPLQRRVPKFGFNNINRKEYQAVNLKTIQLLIDNKKIKSEIRKPANQKKTLLALGLKKIGQVVEHQDTPNIVGMINKVKHLVAVVK